jgi:hypothetical protein
MFPLIQWRYSVADGNLPPGVRFTFLDYVALAFILSGGEELLRRPREGLPIYVPGFFLGLVALLFRDKSPQFVSWLTSWFCAPKRLTIALMENADLKKQLAARTDDESRTALAKTEGLQQVRNSTTTKLFSPLQIEAFTIAKDLRDFSAAHPFPELPDPDFEMDHESLSRLIDTRATEQQKWRQKLLHAYANRGFGPRITALMHHLGEELEYPAYVPDFAENLRVPTKDTVPKLAQQIEMVAIWINRKERNEVDLLHPKP